MEYPFGWIGILATAGILYLIITRIVEKILIKTGHKQEEQYKDLEETPMKPTIITAIAAMLTILTLYFTKETTKIDWTQIITITAIIATATLIITALKRTGDPKKLTRA